MNEISLTDEMIRAFTDADPEQVRKAVNELHENEKDDELSLDMLENVCGGSIAGEGYQFIKLCFDIAKAAGGSSVESFVETSANMYLKHAFGSDITVDEVRSAARTVWNRFR